MKIKIFGKSIYEMKWLCVVFLLILVKPAYFGQFDLLSKFYTYGSFAVTLILFILFFMERKMNLTFLWIFLFYGVSLAATALGSGAVYTYCRTEFCALGTCMMFALWIDKEPVVLLKACQVLQIYVYINFLTILMYPNGMYTEMYSANWFLGYKNPQIRTILPILVFALIYSYWQCGRINLRTWALTLCCLATFILINSSTGLVGFFLFLALVILFNGKKRWVPKIINLITAFIAVVVLEIGILFFNIQYLFSYLIENVLGKSLDFTHRINIWLTSLDMISEKPLLGYGYLSGEEYASFYNYTQGTHPHNYIFYIMCYGGIVLLTVYIFGLIYANMKLMKERESAYGRIVMFSIISFIVMGITESLVSTVLLYPIYIVAMNIDKIAALGYCNEPAKYFWTDIKFVSGKLVLRR